MKQIISLKNVQKRVKTVYLQNYKTWKSTSERKQRIICVMNVLQRNSKMREDSKLQLIGTHILQVTLVASVSREYSCIEHEAKG